MPLPDPIIEVLTIFPAKPSQIENEPENSPLSRKQKTEPSGLMC
jgi:hypothetical protein